MHVRMVRSVTMRLGCLQLTVNIIKNNDDDDDNYDEDREIYRWRELPQVSFLSRQKFCRDTRLSRPKYA